MTTPKTSTHLICPDCGAPMVLRKTKKYPQKNGDPGLFYGCRRFPVCKSTHGAHPDGRPLGIPANKETKAARILAHDAFDVIWRDKRLLSRREAYDWLSARLGHEAHMGEMGIEECEQVVALCTAFDMNDPAAVSAVEKGRSAASAQSAKRKEQRKNWSKEKRRKYNREKRKRQKANRARRKASEAGVAFPDIQPNSTGA